MTSKEQDLIREAEELTKGLADDVEQIDAVVALYSRFVAAGLEFPIHLEEHSLTLILRYLRPDDKAAANRLATVLRLQGKPVPQNISVLMGEGAVGSGALRSETEALRARLSYDKDDTEEISQLYVKYVAAGVPFPRDLEIHSLRLILKFLRPDDERVAYRLNELLSAAGEAVSQDLQMLAFRSWISPPEEIAALTRKQAKAQTGVPLHERLAFVFGLPKSASRLMVKALAAMHPLPGFRRGAVLPYSTGYITIDVCAELRLDTLAGFSGGGVVHTHASPTPANIQTLSQLGLGHVVTVRHPADQIAAFLCEKRRRQLASFSVSAIARKILSEGVPRPHDIAGEYAAGDGRASKLFSPTGMFPVDQRYFLPSVDIDDALAHMIEAGYLFHVLQWIVEWQVLRVRNLSVLVRYEDLIDSPRSVLTAASDAAFGHADAIAIQRGIEVFEGSPPSDEVDADIYPRGSTAAAGIWTNYLSPANQRRFNEVCKKFLGAHPYGQVLPDLYDDLFL